MQVSPMTEHRISLTQAREMVGRTMNIAPDLWLWDHDDILWIAGQWRIFAHELELCHQLTDDTRGRDLPGPAAVRATLREALEWWAVEAPLGVRILSGFLLVFMYAFILGLL